MNLYQMGGKDNIEKALAQFRWVVQKDPTNIKAVITVNKIESAAADRRRRGRAAAGADRETA